MKYIFEDAALTLFPGYSSPGRHMARASVWLTAGSILAAFNLKTAVDADGLPIKPSGEYVSAILR